MSMETQEFGTADQHRSGLLTCPDGSRPKILLAEDSAAARVLTSALLRRMGCDVDAVEHGEEALAHIQTFGYDLVLMDIEMPVMDGVVAAQEIRALGGAAGRTPIIALSAFMADTRRAAVWQECFDGSLAKPAGKEQLREVIQNALSQAKPRQTAAPADDAAAGTPKQAAEESFVDPAAMAQVKAQIAPAAWGELLESAISEMREFARTIAMAQSSSDTNTMLHYSHKLQGIARTFAAPKLADLAFQLESDVDAQSPAELADQVAAICKCVENTTQALAATQASR